MVVGSIPAGGAFPAPLFWVPRFSKKQYKMTTAYACAHCGADLDKGDALAHVTRVYAGDAPRAARAAAAYGWSDANRVHFTRSVIVQPAHEPQYVQCPECKRPDPLGERRV